MVIHNGIGAQINSEHATQQLDAIDNPLATVFKVKPGDRVRATQKGSPYAPGDAVVIRCVLY
jgi:hypothetical protein